MSFSVKTLIVEHLVRDLPQGAKVLDLGCGRAENWTGALLTRPDIEYLGIEPKAADAEAARDQLRSCPGAKIENAYAGDRGENAFDAVVSLSVLEHVKYLEEFIRTSVRAARPGAPIVHFYDLGHALWPHSMKERLQVFLGNHAPWSLPVGSFSAYVDEAKVRRMLETAGAEIERATYHQMPGHKFFALKAGADQATEALLQDLYEWEFRSAPVVSGFDRRTRERMFQSVCLWARKKKL